MEFIIAQNATFPVLKYNITELVENNTIPLDALKAAVVTFSMIDVETGRLAIANRPAGLAMEESEFTTISDEINYNYFLVYKWQKRETSKAADFIGEFKLDFVDTKEAMTLPLDSEHVNITIKGGITKTSYSTETAYTYPSIPQPTGSTMPTNQVGIIESYTYLQLKGLKESGSLKQGKYYILSDFRSIHTHPTEDGIEGVEGLIEPLLLQATDVDKFDQVVQSTIYESDILKYNFDMYLTGTSLTSEFRGVITYREDTVKNISAYFDWRQTQTCTSCLNHIYIGENCQNITLGVRTKHVYIGDNSTDIIIGRQCEKIYFGKNTDNVRIGDGCSDLKFGDNFTDLTFGDFINDMDFTVLTDIFVTKNLTINNYKRSGEYSMRVNFTDFNINSDGTYSVGILPKGVMIHEFDMDFVGIANLNDGARKPLMSAGISSVSITDLFSFIELDSVYESSISAVSTTTKTPIESYLTLTFNQCNYSLINDTYIEILVKFIFI